MNGTVYIDKICIGEVNFKVVDESMGGISGQLHPNHNYSTFKEKIRELSERNGIANVDDINIEIHLKNGSDIDQRGGIGIMDILGTDEIVVEAAGLRYDIIEKIKNAP